MDAKELKKLAKACREAGIKHYKCGDVEFTLADEAPVSPYKQAKAAKQSHGEQGEVEMPDALTDEQILFYSANPGQPISFESDVE